MKNYFLAISLLYCSSLFAQSPIINRVEPAFWWTGMQMDTIEVLLHGTGIASGKLTLSGEGATLLKVDKVENPNYLFATLVIDKKSGNYTPIFTFNAGKKKQEIPFPLKQRNSGKNLHQGINQNDFMYLLMPDRFANGDLSNDNVAGMLQPIAKREIPLERHGGDLQGIINHLDYFEDLNVTALWLNPVYENDQDFESYHGYAITDHYAVDRRFGTNSLYKQLVDSCHKRNIKVVKDVVYNHVGLNHWFIKDLPSSDWIHQFDKFTKTNYRAATLLDPYASDYDKDIMRNGWFDVHMPDLNQQNTHLANYLIQNTVWWVENFDLDAVRIDTYAYPDLDFMNNLVKAVRTEYPQILVFGETWVQYATIQNFFTEGLNAVQSQQSSMEAVTDFQVYFALQSALNEGFGWNSGVMKLYYTLAQDFIAKSPNKNVTFLDNHDVDRFFGTVGKDIKKFNVGIDLLMTLRGIPCVFYGTELLMPEGGNHGILRKDFPGGWPTDSVNKFLATNRTIEENQAFDRIKTLAAWRQNSNAIATGEFKQFIPFDNGVYAYFWYTNNECVMVICNTDKNDHAIDYARFNEILKDYSCGTKVLNGNKLCLDSELTLGSMESIIIEFKK